MPAKRLDDKHARLVAAAGKKLREIGEPVLADAVDKTMTPEHAVFLRSTQGWSKWTNAPGLGVSMDEPVRAHLHAAAAAAGVDLSSTADEGLAKFLDGKFTPEKPQRAAPGSVTKTVTLNLRPDKDLQKRADARCKEMKRDAGWNLVTSQVVKQYLLARFPMPAAD